MHSPTKMKFLGKGFHKIAHEQTNTPNTDSATKRITIRIRGWLKYVYGIICISQYISIFIIES